MALRRDSDPIGTALAAAAGLLAGLATGVLLGGMLGNVNQERVRHAVRRLGGRPKRPDRDPDELAREIKAAIRLAPETRGARVDVRAVGPGLLELTGSAPDAVSRLAAAELARAHEGVDVVVNRILVAGSDLPPRPVPSRS